MGTSNRCVLVGDDEAVVDAVLAAAAALGVGVERLDAAAAVARWAEFAQVLVAGGVAAEVAGLGPRPRPGVFLVGTEAPVLARWSVALGGQVIVLPDGLASLTAVLSDDPGGGAVVAVLGGSGGIGASTLAAGLAVAARRAGLSTALVDADPRGGGIDLLLGAERTPGWRWSSLVGARGEVTDVRKFLPQVAGLTVVSMARPGRGQPAEPLPSAEAARAVLGSLARHHALVLIDAGRGEASFVRPALAGCAASLVAVGSGVRQVAAAGAVLAASELAEPRLVVRAGAGSRVPAEVVGRALGCRVAGWLPEDPGLVAASERGEPPGRTGRGRWAKAVAALLTELGVGRER